MAGCSSRCHWPHPACVRFGFTPDEALRGATFHAVAALGLAANGGARPGCSGRHRGPGRDPAGDPVYWLGADLAARVVVAAGREVGATAS